jgi:hypothetical protein
VLFVDWSVFAGNFTCTGLNTPQPMAIPFKSSQTEQALGVTSPVFMFGFQLVARIHLTMVFSFDLLA